MTKIAILGLLYKMTGAAAVSSYTIGADGFIRIWIKAIGIGGIWIEAPAKAVKMPSGRLQQREIPTNRFEFSRRTDTTEGTVIEVDLVGAWADNVPDSVHGNAKRDGEGDLFVEISVADL